MEIPGYKILETLGQGGMATVYLAIQESFERKVAIKVMSPQLASDPSFGDRFQREAKIVSQLNHPNIVTVYDVGQVDDHHYLAMEYVPGKELRYRRQELSLLEKIKVVKEIASALHYAGNKGYVHRDVKPENIMLNEEDGRAILMDFGIARATDTNHSMTKTGTAIGTPYYMSPEQAQGKSVDNRSDLYSLGVVFFQLLSGHVPYDAESSVAIGIKHLTEPVPFLPKHLRIFQPIIERVMAKEPDKRYQNGLDLIQDLDKVNMMELDNVEAIAQKESEIAANTDPSAPTIMTPAPPTLNTGNVTTADAKRTAAKLQAEPRDHENTEKSNNTSVALFAVVMLAIVVGGWFYLQSSKKAPPPLAETTMEPPKQTSEAVSPPTLTEDPEVATVELETQEKSEASAETTMSLSAIEPPQEPLVEEPSELDLLLEEAETLSKNSDNSTDASNKLVNTYRQILALDPESKVAMDGISEQFDLHIQQIENAAQNKDLDSARLWMENSKTTFPDLSASDTFTVLEQELSKAEQIREALAQAEEYLKADALTSPENENAYDTYQAVLALDPENKAAQQGLEKIADRYAQLANAKRQKGQFSSGMTLIKKGQSIDKNNDNLQQALKAMEKAMVAKADEEARQKEVASLLASADKLKDSGQLVSPEGDNALESYRQVLTLDKNNSQAKKGIQSIETNFLLGVRYQIEEGELDEAKAKLQEADDLFPNNSEVGELLALYEHKTEEAKAAALAASKPRITKFTVHHQDFRSMALLPRDMLPIGRTAYFGFVYENFEGATALLQSILYDGARTVKISQKPVVVTGSDGEAFFSITRPVEGFQDGVYNIDLLLNGEVIHQGKFTVSH